MVMKVFPNTGQHMVYRQASGFQYIRRANAGELQDFWRVDAGGGNNNFAPRPGRYHLAACFIFNPGGALAFKDDAVDIGAGHKLDIAAAEGGPEIGIGGGPAE